MKISHGCIQDYNGQALVDDAKENIKKIGQSKYYFENKSFTAPPNLLHNGVLPVDFLILLE